MDTRHENADGLEPEPVAPDTAPEPAAESAPAPAPATPATKRRRRVTRNRVIAYLAAALLGTTFGLAIATFGYAKGYSYLLDDPKACANCHAMQGNYDSWIKSSHGKVATCNDCHTPHDNIVAKYFNKAVNGYFHGYAFTTNTYPDNIRIKGYNLKVAEASCRYCHSEMTSKLNQTRGHSANSEGVSCISCHSDVGHL